VTESVLLWFLPESSWSVWGDVVGEEACVVVVHTEKRVSVCLNVSLTYFSDS